MPEETPQDKPSFVTDEAAGAGSEKPAIAPDPGEDAAYGVADSQARAADEFDVDDAITKTAIDGPGDDE